MGIEYVICMIKVCVLIVSLCAGTQDAFNLFEGLVQVQHVIDWVVDIEWWMYACLGIAVGIGDLG